MNAPFELAVESGRAVSFERHMADSPLGFLYIDTEGIVRYFNQRARDILGIRWDHNESAIKISDLEVLIGCGIPDCFEFIKEGNSLNLSDHQFINGNNQFRSIDLYSNPFYSPEGDNIGIFAIIHDNTEASRERSRLARNDYILTIIAQVSEAVSSTAELDDVLKIILIGVTARQGLGFNRAFLFMYDKEEHCLEGTLAVGPGSGEEAREIWSDLADKHTTLADLFNDLSDKDLNQQESLSEVIKGWKIPYDKAGLLREALEAKKNINIRGLNDCSPETVEILKRIGSDQIVAVPVISRNRMLGVILADNRITGHPIDETLAELLQAFANHSALAIERSQLYDNLKERADELEEKNRQLAESQEQIIRAEKMAVIGELTSSIAHELRNPLTVIGGFANMMLTAGDCGANTEYLNIIMTETQRAEAAIHQVLDYSKASRAAGRHIDFNLLVRRTYDMLLSRIKFDRKKPEFIPTEPGFSIWGNTEQLMYALFQFMFLTIEEIVGEIGIKFSTSFADNRAKMKISFAGDESGKDRLTKTLGQFFGTATGTQKLSILVAGETIRCHGGNYGLESRQGGFPSIYVDLPQWEGKGE